jgi:hypothetical protein
MTVNPASKRVFIKIAILGSFFYINWVPDGYAVNLTAVGALGVGNASVSSSAGFSSGFLTSSYGAGILLNFKMARSGSVELGLLYVPRGFQASFSDGTTAAYTFNTVQVPLAFRYDILKTVSIGIGGYFSHGIGNIAIVGTDSTSQLAYGDGTYGADDSGGLVSLGLKFPLIKVLSLIVDGRYLYGLQNVSKVPGVTTYLRDLQVLGGIRFGI